MNKFEVNSDLFILMNNKNDIPIAIEIRFNKLNEVTRIHSESNWEVHNLDSVFRSMNLLEEHWFTDFILRKTFTFSQIF